MQFQQITCDNIFQSYYLHIPNLTQLNLKYHCHTVGSEQYMQNIATFRISPEAKTELTASVSSWAQSITFILLPKVHKQTLSSPWPPPLQGSELTTKLVKNASLLSRETWAPGDLAQQRCLVIPFGTPTLRSAAARTNSNVEARASWAHRLQQSYAAAWRKATAACPPGRRGRTEQRMAESSAPWNRAGLSGGRQFHRLALYQYSTFSQMILFIG